MPIEGVAVADVSVFVVMLGIILVLWVLLQARSPVSQVPVVGAPGVNLIDGMRNTITSWAYAIEGFLTWQQSQASSLWSSFINNVMAPALTLLDRTLTAQAALDRVFFNFGIGQLRQQLQTLAYLVSGNLVPAVRQLQHQVAADGLYVKSVVVPELASTEVALRATEVELDSTRNQLVRTEQLLATTVSTVALLAPYLPSLQGLTSFEASAAAGVRTLQGEATLTQQQLRDLAEQLQKLLALTAVTALGAVAIENLLRVARDPCSACQGIPLTDLEARLELVEAFGET